MGVSTEERRLVEEAMRAYPLDTLCDLRSHSGTAAKTWRLVTPDGTYLLRTRGSRTAGPETVAFDHALRRHLLERGVPTAAPILTRFGTTFTRVDDKTLELYRLVPGNTIDRAGSGQVRAAAGMLARFHRAAGTFAAAREQPPLAQYQRLGLHTTSSRMEDPALLQHIYAELEPEALAAGHGPAVRVAQAWLSRIAEELDDRMYACLPQTLTHGDYTLANLLFEGNRVVGVFDFDWARWGPRIRDVADGMFFVSGVRKTPLRAGNIWSLTEAVTLTVDRCALWLRHYQEESPLTPAELHALPLALAARWLSVRVEGMAKVPADERLRFAFGNLIPPLDWLDRHWEAVCRCAGGAATL